MIDGLLELIIVDDDVRLGHTLASLLEPANFRTQVMQSLHDALAYPRIASVDFVLVGLQGQGTLNLQHLRHAIRSLGNTRVLAMVSEELESYEELLRQTGVSQVISRRLPPRQLAQFMIAQGEVRLLEEQNFHLRQMIDGRMAYGNLIGGSPPMRALYKLLDQIARTDAPVLVTGEEGTERAEVARAIHQKSERALHSVVVVDCAAGQEDREGVFLFGPPGNGRHAAGPSARGSAFSRAGKGTLVLDRIELLSAEAQRRLLDFLYHPFFQNETPGSPQPLARIIGTAGPNLLGRVEAGEFLRELFYRINILQVRVPPLRERREDLPLLAQHFLRQCASAAPNGSGNQTFSSRALLHLFQYDWPGNMDELEDVVRKVAAASTGMQLEAESLPERIRQAGGTAEKAPSARTTSRLDVPLKEAKRVFETEYFKCLLDRTQGNMTLASRYSRVGRPYLYKKIREYGLQPEDFR